MPELMVTRRPSGKHYLLGVLTVVYTFNLVDRVALGVVFQDIKTELHLSDTDLGLLGGLAFALFYSIVGVPLARWADRGNRVLIIAVTALLWSVAVALSGAAATFAQLLLIRVAVAVGEAGCVPPSLSLISDYFSRSERPRATAIFGFGATISGVVGYFLAGWLNELYGWRTTFVVLGMPGIALAGLVWFTLIEPRRARAGSRPVARHAAETPSQPQPSVREVCVTLWSNVSFRHLLLCLSLIFFFNWGIGQWLPTFFIRSYGLTSAQVGAWLAGICGVAGIAGTFVGGELASRWAGNNERVQLRAFAIGIGCSGMLAMGAYLTFDLRITLVLIGIFLVGLTTANGPLISTMQTLVPEHMRAVSFALAYLVAHFIGMGLGPLTAGALSDLLRPWAGEESLRYALLLMSPGYFWCAWHAWRASRTVTGDVATVYEAGTPHGARGFVSSREGAANAAR